MDYKGYGYPDVSYHGTSAWKPQLDSNSRQLGIMFCEKYAEAESDESMNGFIYAGINMHWVNHDLALPRLPKGQEWRLYIDTAEEYINTDGKMCTIPPRSISIFVAKNINANVKQK